MDEFDVTYWAPVDGGYPVCEDGTQRISCPDGRPVADMGGAGRLETYVNNPYPGHIRGFEIDWQTNFWYLPSRSEEHTSELQSRGHLVCRLLLEKKKINYVLDTTCTTGRHQ